MKRRPPKRLTRYLGRSKANEKPSTVAISAPKMFCRPRSRVESARVPRLVNPFNSTTPVVSSKSRFRENVFTTVRAGEPMSRADRSWR